jgi:hypothetical protein
MLRLMSQGIIAQMANQVPAKLPGLRAGLILLAVYLVVWIPLEGNLWRALLLGAWSCAVGLAHLIQRHLGGRTFSPWQWLGLWAGSGLLLGLGSGLLTLVAMAMKTGLHNHGPEFSRAEISWVIAQTPVWTVAGLLAGLAIGLLTAKWAARTG